MMTTKYNLSLPSPAWTSPWTAFALTMAAYMLLPTEVFAAADGGVNGAAGAESLKAVTDILPKFTATAKTGIKWGAALGGTVLFAVGLSKHSMKVAGYGLGLATVPPMLLETVSGGAALLLD